MGCCLSCPRRPAPEGGAAPLVPGPLEWVQMDGRRVWACFFSRGTAEVAEARWTPEAPAGQGDSELRLLKYLGNVVLYGISATAVTWFPFLLFPWLLMRQAECASGELPSIPWSGYLVFLPLILAGLLLEFAAFRHVLPSVLRVRVPRVMGREVPVAVYVLSQFGISAFCHADIMTNSVFLARALKTQECNQAQYAGVASAAKVLWFVMLIQVLYVIAFVFPIGRVRNMNDTAYFPGFDLRQWGNTPERANRNVVYRTMLEGTQTHQNAIFVLADGARWATIRSFEEGFLTKFHAGRNQGSTAFKALKTTALRSFVFLFMETMLFLAVQCYAYHQGWSTDPKTGIGILSSVIVCLYSIWVDFWRLRTYKQDVKDGHAKYMDLPLDDQKKKVKQFPDEEHVVTKARSFVFWHTSFVIVLVPALVVVFAVTVPLLDG